MERKILVGWISKKRGKEGKAINDLACIIN